MKETLGTGARAGFPWIAQDLLVPHAWFPASSRTPALVTLDLVGLYKVPFSSLAVASRLVRAWSFRGGAAWKEDFG